MFHCSPMSVYHKNFHSGIRNFTRTQPLQFTLYMSKQYMPLIQRKDLPLITRCVYDGVRPRNTSYVSQLTLDTVYGKLCDVCTDRVMCWLTGLLLQDYLQTCVHV
jgi:hypothetical protein